MENRGIRKKNLGQIKKKVAQTKKNTNNSKTLDYSVHSHPNILLESIEHLT
jgi:hypothetical protein